MKYLIFILSLSISLSVFGQETYPHDFKDWKCTVLGKYNYVYNCDNSENFYAIAKSLISLKNPDSSYKASRILWGLFLFDTIKYSIENIDPLINKIEESNRHYYHTGLLGTWKFEWSGSNWGTSETSKNVCKKMTLTENEIIIYSGDSVERRTNYTLVNRSQLYPNSNWKLSDVNIFYLEFTDNNERWAFHFYNKDRLVPYVGQTRTTAILINEMPGCVCGCPEAVYNKIIDNSLITKN